MRNSRGAASRSRTFSTSPLQLIISRATRLSPLRTDVRAVSSSPSPFSAAAISARASINSGSCVSAKVYILYIVSNADLGLQFSPPPSALVAAMSFAVTTSRSIPANAPNPSSLNRSLPTPSSTSLATASCRRMISWSFIRGCRSHTSRVRLPILVLHLLRTPRMELLASDPPTRQLAVPDFDPPAGGRRLMHSAAVRSRVRHEFNVPGITSYEPRMDSSTATPDSSDESNDAS
mmetsp:Transcript_37407/g.76136  ORF Transcript_37407/g.76136 Transcript_37407/m.76136 type:complete len:234 (-) Transcript_37407:23-724(-)